MGRAICDDNDFELPINDILGLVWTVQAPKAHKIMRRDSKDEDQGFESLDPGSFRCGEATFLAITCIRSVSAGLLDLQAFLTATPTVFSYLAYRIFQDLNHQVILLAAFLFVQAPHLGFCQFLLHRACSCSIVAGHAGIQLWRLSHCQPPNTVDQ